MLQTTMSRENADSHSSSKKRTQRTLTERMVESIQQRSSSKERTQRRLTRRTTVVVQKLSFKDRFQRALSKSISVRKRVLKRRLTKEEFSQLKDAVHKQCSNVNRARKNSFEQRLTAIEKTVAELQLVSPGGTELSSGVENLQNVVSVLKSQIYEHLSYMDIEQIRVCREPEMIPITRFTESTSHLNFSSNSERFSSMFRGAGTPSSGTTLSLSCSECLQKRIDYVFSKCGTDFSLFKFDYYCVDRNNYQRKFTYSDSLLKLNSVWQILFYNFEHQD
jgi:hypothetical protein